MTRAPASVPKNSGELTSLYNLASKATPRPDPRPVKHQYPRHERQQRPHPAQQAARAAIRQPLVHLGCDEGEDAGEDVAAEGLGGEGGAGVAVVRVGEVVEDGEVDGEDADGGECDGDGRHDPMDAGCGRPTKHEQADGHECALHARKVQAALWVRGGFPVLLG